MQGHPDDILVLTTRAEVQSMFRSREERIPHRPHLWVDRPVGNGIGKFERFRIARRRINKVKKFLLSHPTIKRIIVKGASLELIAAKRGRVPHRLYITDTESNHLAHRIAYRYATEILLPKSWDFEQSTIFSTDIRIKTYSGILPEAYLDFSAGESARKQAISQIKDGIKLSSNSLSNAPVVFHRSLRGGGIHDDSELINYDSWIRDLQVHFVHTKESSIESTDAAWELPTQIAMFDGVLTGSTTLASEAVIQGVPTLLISRAKRGFLNNLEQRFPEKLFHWKSNEKKGFEKMVESWLHSMNQNKKRQMLISNTRLELEEIIGKSEDS